VKYTKKQFSSNCDCLKTTTMASMRRKGVRR
jgi:hypothetical protein